MMIPIIKSPYNSGLFEDIFDTDKVNPNVENKNKAMIMVAINGIPANICPFFILKTILMQIFQQLSKTV